MNGRRRLLKAGPGIALAGAVAGFAGVLGLHGLTALGAPTAAGPAGPTAAGPSGTSQATAPSSGGDAAGHGRSRAAGSSHRQTTGLARSTTGPGVQFGYGSLTVRVTVRGGRITGLAIASLHTLEPTSQQISTQAIPVLRSEVLAAQSVNVQGVSGASYTSQAYLRSAQAALDTLHAR